MTIDIKPVSILDLKRLHPFLFYNQDWYELHRFVQRKEKDNAINFESYTVIEKGCVPTKKPLYTANMLIQIFLHAYFNNENIAVFEKYIWCKDTDDNGDMIYIGGINNNHANTIEIHRHLTINNNYISVKYE